uniref:Gamma interferon inducible lysosomal thiol reductase GILT n=1 Tax=Strongyloides venezuelensis TaxID=75913 RepID=A0A0K0EVG9_STRVS
MILKVMGARCGIPRQLIYSIVILGLLYFIIRITNDDKNQIIISGDSFDDRYFKPGNLKEVNTLNDNSIKSGNKVLVSVYMEAQCPDTTNFIQTHLLTTWEHLGSTGMLDIQIVPFGKARCEAFGDNDYKCECQHGEAECYLNSLMNCAIHYLKDPNRFVPIIGCVQGKEDLESALNLCVGGKEPSVAEIINKCTVGKEGRLLLAMAGRKTASLNPGISFVPWVMINHKREIDAFYALEENVCMRLNPKPKQCKN